MAKIAFLLLCHKAPEAIVAQVRRLTAAGDCVAIHFDARSPATDFQAIRAELAANPAVTFARRVRCGWGQWSLVQATLNAAQAALAAFPEATHFYAISGDCWPIKTAEHIRARLDPGDADFIETVDFFKGGWIRTGLCEERLHYRHYFNERAHKRLFYLSLDLQRRLGLTRPVPQGLTVRIGSQWWCLRRKTLQAVLDFARSRPDVLRFFRTTWIPDETFFQTVVPHVVPEGEIRSQPPTFLMFTDYGMPVTFHDDHYDFLLDQAEFFARKISPHATGLQDRLAALYTRRRAPIDPSGTGRQLHAFLTRQGREGRRFAPRIWEAHAPADADRRLFLLLCKKWHLGKRLAALAARRNRLTSYDYLFTEAAGALPDLGGLEHPLEKRSRHRRAFLRCLFAATGGDILICLDPAETEAIADLAHWLPGTRVLDVACTFDTDYVMGHAWRIGLVGAAIDAGQTARLAPLLKAELAREADVLAALPLPSRHRISDRGTPERNAAELAEWLDISPSAALEIAATENLFAD